jgi:hypothetical protein
MRVSIRASAAPSAKLVPCVISPLIRARADWTSRTTSAPFSSNTSRAVENVAWSGGDRDFAITMRRSAKALSSERILPRARFP